MALASISYAHAKSTLSGKYGFSINELPFYSALSSILYSFTFTSPLFFPCLLRPDVFPLPPTYKTSALTPISSLLLVPVAQRTDPQTYNTFPCGCMVCPKPSRTIEEALGCIAQEQRVLCDPGRKAFGSRAQHSTQFRTAGREILRLVD